MRPSPSERGFTLIELLVVIVIGSMVMGGAATALIAASNNYTASATRLIQSHDAQLLSSWIVPDIISAGPNAADIDVTTATNTTGCSGSVVPGSANVLKLSWSDFVTAAPSAASYRLEGTLLVRYFCTNGGAPSRTGIGHNVQKAVATLTGQKVNVAVTALVSGSAYSFDIAASRRTTLAPLATTTLPVATTLPPCVITASSTPAADAQASGGHLTADLPISINTTGTCTQLAVSFTPGVTGSALVTVNLTSAGSVWSVTILKNAYSTWTKASHPFSVVYQGVPVGGSPNPIPFVVT